MPELAIEARPEECLAKGPSRINPPEGGETPLRRPCVATLIEVSICEQRSLDSLQEYPVVRRGLGGSANCEEPLHAVRKQGSEVISLLRSHRPAEGERHPLHSERLLQQAPLTLCSVEQRDERKFRAWLRTVVARRG